MMVFLQPFVSVFDRAWDIAKQGGWATAFRQWASSNVDAEWYDSEYNIGSKESPVMGFNFDEWDFQILNALQNAFAEEGMSWDDIESDDWQDGFDDMKEQISEKTWNIATSDTINPMEAVELVIKYIQTLVSEYRNRGLFG